MREIKMKPISLCLVQMGSKGLELVKSHPNVLPESVLNQIVVKSMPFNAKNGDFASSNVDDAVFSGYVFSVPSQIGRDNIASLVAVYNDMKYDTEIIRKVFSFTITELKKYNVADIETVAKILPNLFNGLADKELKIRISSVVTLDFDFKEKEEKDPDDDAINSFGKEMWR